MVSTMHYRDDDTAETPASYGDKPLPEWSGAWKPGVGDLVELRRWRRSRVGLPARFADARVEQFVGNPRIDAIRKSAAVYVQRFGDLLKTGTCMALLGDMGTGKTTLACAVAGELAEAGYSARYWKLSSLIAAVQDTYRRDAPQSSTEVIDDLIEPELLVLDEVGVQRGTQDEAVIINRVLDGRYENMKPTLVVSNLNMDGLQRSLGDRCVDRLRDKRGVFLIFDWKTLRG